MAMKEPEGLLIKFKEDELAKENKPMSEVPVPAHTLGTVSLELAWKACCRYSCTQKTYQIS